MNEMYAYFDGIGLSGEKKRALSAQLSKKFPEYAKETENVTAVIKEAPMDRDTNKGAPRARGGAWKTIAACAAALAVIAGTVTAGYFMRPGDSTEPRISSRTPAASAEESELTEEGGVVEATTADRSYESVAKLLYQYTVQVLTDCQTRGITVNVPGGVIVTEDFLNASPENAQPEQDSTIGTSELAAMILAVNENHPTEALNITEFNIQIHLPTDGEGNASFGDGLQAAVLDPNSENAYVYPQDGLYTQMEGGTKLTTTTSFIPEDDIPEGLSPTTEKGLDPYDYDPSITATVTYLNLDPKPEEDDPRSQEIYGEYGEVHLPEQRTETDYEE